MSTVLEWAFLLLTLIRHPVCTVVTTGASLVNQTVKNLPAMWETWLQSLSQKDPLKKGMVTYPLQYSCLENSIDRGAWWAIVHGVAELDTTERLTLFIPLSSFTSAPHQTLRVQSSHCLGRSHIITKGKRSSACPQEAGRALQLVPALPHRLSLILLGSTERACINRALVSTGDEASQCNISFRFISSRMIWL